MTDPALNARYSAFVRAGWPAAAALPPQHARDALYGAVLAWRAGERAAAQTWAARAAALDDAPLYAECAAYLRRAAEHGPTQAYATAEGFGQFIRGGGNVPLYQRTSAALAEVYARYEALRLLDVGTGDGLALLPALNAHVAQVDVVEPSAALLAGLAAALQARGVAHTLSPVTLQQFAAAHADDHWALAQATFSLQSISFDERPAALAWLRAHCDRVLIAEFDAPDFREAAAPDRFAYVAERYARGLAEYPAGSAAVQGFLMPVMFGYFDAGAARANYEQPAAEWAQALRAAGFSSVELRPLYAYFWADAVLLDAR